MNAMIRKANLALLALVIMLMGANVLSSFRSATAIDSDGQCEELISRIEQCPPGTAYVTDPEQLPWFLCQTDVHGCCCEYTAENIYCMLDDGTLRRAGYVAELRDRLPPPPPDDTPGFGYDCFLNRYRRLDVA